MVLLAAVAVVAAGASAVRELIADDGSDDKPTAVTRVSSERVPGNPEPLVHDGEVATTWRIRYRVASPGTVQTEVVTVRAPFESHTDVTVGGAVSEAREAALGVAVTKQARGAIVGLAPVPEAAGFRPGAVIPGALEHDLVERREQRTVADRRCQAYRTASVFSGATFATPTSSVDYVELCVDREGLLLELIETFESRVIRQRVAVDVRVGIDVTDAELRAFPHEQTIPPNQGGGSVRAVDPASQPVGPFFVLDTPPPGFTTAGRYEVIPPQPDISRPETRNSVVAAMSDVFVRDADMVVVERGARLDKTPPWELDDRFPDVELGPALGTGEFLAGTSGGEIRALLPSGRFVRVYGTVSLDVLVDTARALRPTDGGTGPVYLDD